MQGVCKIHPHPSPVECLNGNQWLAQCDPRQTEKLGKSLMNGIGREVIGAPQDPLGFEEDGRADENSVLAEQATGPKRVLLIVANQKPDDHVGVDSDHDRARRRASRATASSMSRMVRGGPSQERQPATSSSEVTGNTRAGRRRTPSTAVFTSNVIPARQPSASRSAFGMITCPLLESLVVSIGTSIPAT